MSDETLSNTVCEQVAAMARAIGVPATARKLKLNKHVVPKLAARLPVRDGTILAAARGLGLDIGAPAPLALSTLPSPTDLG